MNNIRVVFDGQLASVYNEVGEVMNIGDRPVDRAFARNVCKANGYKPEESMNGNVRTVVLRAIK